MWLLSLFMEAVKKKKRFPKLWGLPGVLDGFLQVLPHNVEWFYVSIFPFSGELSAERCIVLKMSFLSLLQRVCRESWISARQSSNNSSPVPKGLWWSLIWCGLTGVKLSVNTCEERKSNNKWNNNNCLAVHVPAGASQQEWIVMKSEIPWIQRMNPSDFSSSTVSDLLLKY